MPTLIDRHLKIPQYLQLAEHLRQEIADGRLQPDDRLPSLNESKAQFGANQRTVEKAHDLLETDGLIRREPGRGVFVNHPAPRKMTGNVGFVAPSNVSLQQHLAYWGSVLAGIRSMARERGYHLLLIDDGSDFDHWDKIDGAVLCDIYAPRNSHLGLPQLPKDVPVVSLFYEVPGVARVTSDDFDGTYRLARHLIELGHRRIAYLGTVNAGASQLKERKEGYLKALQESNIEPDPCSTRELCEHNEWDELPHWFARAAEHSMHRWLQEDWAQLGCTALIAQNDETATGAIRAYEAAGLQVPRDVSVVGYDGLPSYQTSQRLTTIQVPLFDVGERAMRSLLDWLGDSTKTPQDVCLPVHFVQGQTTGPPLSEN